MCIVYIFQIFREGKTTRQMMFHTLSPCSIFRILNAYALIRQYHNIRFFLNLSECSSSFSTTTLAGIL